MAKPSPRRAAPGTPATRPGSLSGAGSEEEKTRFFEYLTRRGLKLTRQREAVVNEIFGGAGHFEAEEIVHRLKSNRLRVSRATVYRTLDLLKECLLVEKLDFGTPHSFYEHVQAGEHHDHLICQRCGQVIEFHNARLEKLQDEICRGFDFLESHHSLRIFGLCSRCRKTAEPGTAS